MKTQFIAVNIINRRSGAPLELEGPWEHHGFGVSIRFIVLQLKVGLKNNVHYAINTVVKLMLRVNFFKMCQLNCDKKKCLNTKSNFKSYLHRK